MQKFFYRTFRRLAALSGAVSVLLFSSLVYYNRALPDHFYVAQGKSLTLSNCSVIRQAENVKTGLQNVSAGTNKTFQLNLFGVVPVKSARVDTVDRPVVVPGGTPFGIKLYTKGVMAVDFGNVETATGVYCPAKLAGLQKGDMLLSVGSKKVTSNEELQDIIEESDGKAMTVSYQRDGHLHSTTLKPALSDADQRYKSGVWVRDSSAGIGTITYYDPSTGNFGGLGHGICDVDTGKIMPLTSGEVCLVSINSVVKGQVGTPGELQGSFVSGLPCGFLQKNSEEGVFGKLNQAPNDLSGIPIKLKQEVNTGNAEILCTLDNSGIHRYSVRIERVDLNPDQETKNMLIEVTDPALLEKTGGIVQGMSGSPILQDGKLIGAVTHVFVNNPQKGYGIFAENMLDYK